MRLRTGLPFFCVLTALLLAPALPAAPAPPVPFLRPGSLEIAGDPAAISMLPIDAAALGQALCDGSIEIDGGRISPSGSCDLSIIPKMWLSVEEILVDAATLGVAVRPHSSTPWEAEEPLRTSCGLWDVSMQLDPAWLQPVSQLVLKPSKADPNQGVFAGEVALTFRFRFVARDKGTVYELPDAIPLELTGHWAALPADEPSLGDGASNLVLFAGVVAGQWTSYPNCATWVGKYCRICLQARSSVLGPLGPPTVVP